MLESIATHTLTAGLGFLVGTGLGASLGIDYGKKVTIAKLDGINAQDRAEITKQYKIIFEALGADLKDVGVNGLSDKFMQCVEELCLPKMVEEEEYFKLCFLRSQLKDKEDRTGERAAMFERFDSYYKKKKGGVTDKYVAQVRIYDNLYCLLLHFIDEEKNKLGEDSAKALNNFRKILKTLDKNFKGMIADDRDFQFFNYFGETTRKKLSDYIVKDFDKIILNAIAYQKQISLVKSFENLIDNIRDVAKPIAGFFLRTLDVSASNHNEADLSINKMAKKQISLDSDGEVLTTSAIGEVVSCHIAQTEKLVNTRNKNNSFNDRFEERAFVLESELERKDGGIPEHKLPVFGRSSSIIKIADIKVDDIALTEIARVINYLNIAIALLEDMRNITERCGSEGIVLTGEFEFRLALFKTFYSQTIDNFKKIVKDSPYYEDFFRSLEKLSGQDVVHIGMPKDLTPYLPGSIGTVPNTIHVDVLKEVSSNDKIVSEAHEKIIECVKARQKEDDAPDIKPIILNSDQFIIKMALICADDAIIKAKVFENLNEVKKKVSEDNIKTFDEKFKLLEGKTNQLIEIKNSIDTLKTCFSKKDISKNLFMAEDFNFSNLKNNEAFKAMRVRAESIKEKCVNKKEFKNNQKVYEAASELVSVLNKYLNPHGPMSLPVPKSPRSDEKQSRPRSNSVSTSMANSSKHNQNVRLPIPEVGDVPQTSNSNQDQAIDNFNNTNASASASVSASRSSSDEYNLSRVKNSNQSQLSASSFDEDSFDEDNNQINKSTTDSISTTSNNNLSSDQNLEQLHQQNANAISVSNINQIVSTNPFDIQDESPIAVLKKAKDYESKGTIKHWKRNGQIEELDKAIEEYEANSEGNRENILYRKLVNIRSEVSKNAEVTADKNGFNSGLWEILNGYLVKEGSEFKDAFDFLTQIDIYDKESSTFRASDREGQITNIKELINRYIKGESQPDDLLKELVAIRTAVAKDAKVKVIDEKDRDKDEFNSGLWKVLNEFIVKQSSPEQKFEFDFFRKLDVYDATGPWFRNSERDARVNEVREILTISKNEVQKLSDLVRIRDRVQTEVSAKNIINKKFNNDGTVKDSGLVDILNEHIKLMEAKQLKNQENNRTAFIKILSGEQKLEEAVFAKNLNEDNAEVIFGKINDNVEIKNAVQNYKLKLKNKLSNQDNQRIRNLGGLDLELEIEKLKLIDLIQNAKVIVPSNEENNEIANDELKAMVVFNQKLGESAEKGFKSFAEIVNMDHNEKVAGAVILKAIEKAESLCPASPQEDVEGNPILNKLVEQFINELASKIKYQNVLGYMPLVGSFISQLSDEKASHRVCKKEVYNFCQGKLLAHLRESNFDTVQKFFIGSDDHNLEARKLFGIKPQKQEAKLDKVSPELGKLITLSNIKNNLSNESLIEILDASIANEFKKDVEAALKQKDWSRVEEYLNYLAISQHHKDIETLKAVVSMVKDHISPLNISSEKDISELSKFVDKYNEISKLPNMLKVKDVDLKVSEKLKGAIKQIAKTKLEKLFKSEESKGNEEIKRMLVQGCVFKIGDNKFFEKDEIKKVALEFVDNILNKNTEKSKELCQKIATTFKNAGFEDDEKEIQNRYDFALLLEEMGNLKDSAREIQVGVEGAVNSLIERQKEFSEVDYFSREFSEKKGKFSENTSVSNVFIPSEKLTLFSPYKKFLNHHYKKYGYELNLVERNIDSQLPTYVGPTLEKYLGKDMEFRLYNISPASENYTESNKDAYIKFDLSVQDDSHIELINEKLKNGEQKLLISNLENSEISSCIKVSCNGSNYGISYNFDPLFQESVDRLKEESIVDAELERLREIKKTLSEDKTLSSERSSDSVGKATIEEFLSKVKSVLELSSKLDNQGEAEELAKGVITNISDTILNRLGQKMTPENLKIYSKLLRPVAQAFEDSAEGKKCLKYLDALDVFIGNKGINKESMDLLDTLDKYDGKQKEILTYVLKAQYKEILENNCKQNNYGEAEFEIALDFVKEADKKLNAGLGESKLNDGYFDYLKTHQLLLDDTKWNLGSDSLKELGFTEKSFAETREKLDAEQKEILENALKCRREKLLEASKEKYKKVREGKDQKREDGTTDYFTLKNNIMSIDSLLIISNENNFAVCPEYMNAIRHITSSRVSSANDTKLQAWFVSALSHIVVGGDPLQLRECELRLLKLCKDFASSDSSEHKSKILTLIKIMLEHFPKKEDVADKSDEIDEDEIEIDENSILLKIRKCAFASEFEKLSFEPEENKKLEEIKKYISAIESHYAVFSELLGELNKINCEGMKNTKEIRNELYSWRHSVLARDLEFKSDLPLEIQRIFKPFMDSLAELVKPTEGDKILAKFNKSKIIVPSLPTVKVIEQFSKNQNENLQFAKRYISKLDSLNFVYSELLEHYGEQVKEDGLQELRDWYDSVLAGEPVDCLNGIKHKAGYNLNLMLSKTLPNSEELEELLGKVPLLIKLEGSNKEEDSFYIYGASENGHKRLVKLDANQELNVIVFDDNKKLHISAVDNAVIFNEITLKKGHAAVTNEIKDRFQFLIESLAKLNKAYSNKDKLERIVESGIRGALKSIEGDYAVKLYDTCSHNQTIGYLFAEKVISHAAEILFPDFKVTLGLLVKSGGIIIESNDESLIAAISVFVEKFDILNSIKCSQVEFAFHQCLIDFLLNDEGHETIKEQILVNFGNSKDNFINFYLDEVFKPKIMDREFGKAFIDGFSSSKKTQETLIKLMKDKSTRENIFERFSRMGYDLKLKSIKHDRALTLSNINIHQREAPALIRCSIDNSVDIDGLPVVEYYIFGISGLGPVCEKLSDVATCRDIFKENSEKNGEIKETSQSIYIAGDNRISGVNVCSLFEEIHKNKYHIPARKFESDKLCNVSNKKVVGKENFYQESLLEVFCELNKQKCFMEGHEEKLDKLEKKITEFKDLIKQEKSISYLTLNPIEAYETYNKEEKLKTEKYNVLEDIANCIKLVSEKSVPLNYKEQMGKILLGFVEYLEVNDDDEAAKCIKNKIVKINDCSLEEFYLSARLTSALMNAPNNQKNAKYDAEILFSIDTTFSKNLINDILKESYMSGSYGCQLQKNVVVLNEECDALDNLNVF